MGEIPPFPSQTVDSGWYVATKATQVFMTRRTTSKRTYGKERGAGVFFFLPICTFVLANRAEQTTAENRRLLNIRTPSLHRSSTSAQVSKLLPWDQRKEIVKDLSGWVFF